MAEHQHDWMWYPPEGLVVPAGHRRCIDCGKFEPLTPAQIEQMREIHRSAQRTGAEP